MIKIKRFTVIFSIFTATLVASATDVQIVTSSPEAQWVENGKVELSSFDNSVSYDVMVTKYTAQTMQGFGGCFNADCTENC